MIPHPFEGVGVVDGDNFLPRETHSLILTAVKTYYTMLNVAGKMGVVAPCSGFM